MIRDVGNYEEATKFFSYVLEAFTKAYGNKSAHVALVLGDMGDCLRLEKSEEVPPTYAIISTHVRISIHTTILSYSRRKDIPSEMPSHIPSHTL